MSYSSFNTQFTRVGPVNDNCPTIWTYVTTDTIAVCVASGYFNAVAGKLKPGDLIYITSAGSPWSGAFAVVLTNTRNLTASPPVAGVVKVSAPLSFSMGSW